MAIIEQGGQSYRVLDTVDEARGKLRHLLGGFVTDSDVNVGDGFEEFTLAGGNTTSSGSLFVTAQGGVIAVVPDDAPRLSYRAAGFGGEG